MSFLDEIIGATYIGCLVTATFYGVTFLQAMLYFFRCEEDGKVIKLLVVIVTILDTLHMALVAHYGYIVIVKQFADLTKLAENPWSLPVSILVNVVNDTIIRAFFAYKAYILSGKRLLCVIPLAITIITAFVLTLLADTSTMKISLSVNLSEQTASWKIFASFSLTAFSDLAIAATLCFCLYKSRSGCFDGTNRLIDTLCKYIINTGMFATLWSIGCLLSFALKPRTEITFVFYLSLSKIYTNAFLASLNVRESLRQKSSIVTFIPKSNEASTKPLSFSPRGPDRISCTSSAISASTLPHTPNDLHEKKAFVLPVLPLSSEVLYDGDLNLSGCISSSNDHHV
ncbi:hypothetical protein SCHPADRAFT_938688 [Schizopora paradoxa]|uniref:DUF6534 domain-containing protein n=1 Tax=Schizopora paradoxa TaxID=27342 RepID=A0A0H2RUC4_9AGAM|nr:hypothetical protein SCHPADRAFT_938688 [Schizopora paradoxa]